MDSLSPYKLTVVAVIGVIILAAAGVEIMGSLQAAAAFLGFAAPTLVALLALLRGEQNANAIHQAKTVTATLMSAHADTDQATQQKLDELRNMVNGVSEQATEAARLQGELAGRDFEAAKREAQQ